MEPVFRQEFEISGLQTDRFGRLKPSAILFFVQEVAGGHCKLLHLDWDTLAHRRLFWAVIRHRVQITRLPKEGETITVETWPMPTTRVAYPRSVVAFDSAGQELFRSISLWVLMDMDSRAMILPGKSGVLVEGILRGTELATPGSLTPASPAATVSRPVCYTDLDLNGHMNNARYLDWIADILPSDFHRDHPVRDFTMCYLSEAREGDLLDLHWEMSDPSQLRVEILRQSSDPAHHRVFSAQFHL